MPKSPFIRFARYLAVPACLLAVLLMAATASAEGRVQWTNTHPKERDGHSWNLEVAIFLGARARHPAHADEVRVHADRDTTSAIWSTATRSSRASVPAAQPAAHHRETSTSASWIRADGNIQKRTKFSFRVTRAHDFKAGEYKVTLRDARNGRIIGRPTQAGAAGREQGNRSPHDGLRAATRRRRRRKRT